MKKRLAILVAAGVLGLSGAGIAGATVAKYTGPYTACATKAHVLEACTVKGAVKVQLGAQGAQGLQGLRGPQGARGAAGTPGSAAPFTTVIISANGFPVQDNPVGLSCSGATPVALNAGAYNAPNVAYPVNETSWSVYVTGTVLDPKPGGETVNYWILCTK